MTPSTTSRGRYLERDVPILAVAAALLAVALGLKARAEPLWFDELFTYYVARRSSLEEVLRAILAGGDNLPPLDACIRYLCMRLFGPSELSFRLPSILAFLLALIWLFRTVLRVTGSRRAAYAAFLMPIPTLAGFHYGTEGRPYVLLFAVAAGVLDAWTRTLKDPRSLGADVQLTLLLALTLPLHYYGIVIGACVALGELSRVLVWKQPFRLRTIADALVAGLSFAAWTPFISTAMTQVTGHPAVPVRFGWLLYTYDFLFREAPFWCAVGLGYIVLAQHLPRKRTLAVESPVSSASPPRELGPFVVSIFVLGLLTPLFNFALALLTKQWAERYSLPCVVGLAALLGVAVAKMEEQGRKWARITLGVLALAASYEALSAFKDFVRAPRPGPEPAVVAALRASRGPVFIEDSHLFFQQYHYLPAFRHRLVRPVDRALAVAYQGHDVDELSFLSLRQTLDIQLPDRDGVFDTRSFTLIGTSGRGWLTPWLVELGAELRLRAVIGRLAVYDVQAPARSELPPQRTP